MLDLLKIIPNFFEEVSHDTYCSPSGSFKFPLNTPLEEVLNYIERSAGVKRSATVTTVDFSPLFKKSTDKADTELHIVTEDELTIEPPVETSVETSVETADETTSSAESSDDCEDLSDFFCTTTTRVFRLKPGARKVSALNCTPRNYLVHYIDLCTVDRVAGCPENLQRLVRTETDLEVAHTLLDHLRGTNATRGITRALCNAAFMRRVCGETGKADSRFVPPGKGSARHKIISRVADECGVKIAQVCAIIAHAIANFVLDHKIVDELCVTSNTTAYNDAHGAVVKHLLAEGLSPTRIVAELDLALSAKSISLLSNLN